MKRKLIINLGLARCGTTALYHYFRSQAEYSTPEDIKELKFFLHPNNPEEYLKHFKFTDDSILFESSPPYMHKGLDRFRKVIGRISVLRELGFDVYFLINIRNLLERAFSHYWHDISSQYSIFGKYMGMSKLDDPRRFGCLYETGFLDELTNPKSSSKFLPDIGQMLHLLCSVMGADRVKIVLQSNLDKGIDAFQEEVAPELDPPPIKTPRILETRAPAYLYGGENGETFSAALPDGTEEVNVPAHCCVLFARRHQELLLGTTYDLKCITDAEAKWTKSLTADLIPQSVTDYLVEQRKLLGNLPQEFFLATPRDEVLEEVFAIPPMLSVKTTVPDASAVKHLVSGQQV